MIAFRPRRRISHDRPGRDPAESHGPSGRRGSSRAREPGASGRPAPRTPSRWKNQLRPRRSKLPGGGGFDNSRCSDYRAYTVKHSKATLRDIARKAGVTTATVSYVLNAKPGSRISPATQERVWAAARQLHYTPHADARSLATGRSHSIAVYFPGPLDSALQDPFASETLRGILQKAAVTDYAVQIVVEGHLPRSHRVDGWVAIAARRPLPADDVDEPVVYLDPAKPFGPLSHWAQNRLAGTRLAERLSRRYSRILFLLHEPLASSPHAYRERYAGFVEGFRAPDAVQLAHRHPDKATGAETVLRAWRENLDDGERGAIVCVSDMLAGHVQAQLQNAGVSVPDEVAVCGFDNTLHGQISRPALTTVDLGSGELGSQAAQVLFDLLEDRKPAFAAPEPLCVARGSCPLD
ncbi:MAG: LacI family DNA-binding transcriptional regulator [Verrucomicrobiae bacterium]|nr:LacI family DNA-binding transcriptional regulator [Verrucomicrobiae bacterium]